MHFVTPNQHPTEGESNDEQVNEDWRFAGASCRRIKTPKDDRQRGVCSDDRRGAGRCAAPGRDWIIWVELRRTELRLFPNSARWANPVQYTRLLHYVLYSSFFV